MAGMVVGAVVGARIFGGRRRSDTLGGGGSEPRLWWISAHFGPISAPSTATSNLSSTQLDAARLLIAQLRHPPDFLSSAQLSTRNSRNLPSAQPAKHHTQIELKKYPRVPSAEPFLQPFNATALVYRACLIQASPKT